MSLKANSGYTEQKKKGKWRAIEEGTVWFLYTICLKRDFPQWETDQTSTTWLVALHFSVVLEAQQVTTVSGRLISLRMKDEKRRISCFCELEVINSHHFWWRGINKSKVLRLTVSQGKNHLKSHWLTPPLHLIFFLSVFAHPEHFLIIKPC